MESAGQTRIQVVGVGGAGTVVVNRMIDAGVDGAEFVTVNTDTQVLELSRAPRRILIGKNVTGGHGVGARPEVGRRVIEENRNQVIEALTGSEMVFIMAGMGGGTGSGVAPIVAQIAREQGALAVGIVTTPFQWEGDIRKFNAEQGIAQIKEHVHTLITLHSQRLLSNPLETREDIPLTEVFQTADNVMIEAARSIIDLIIISENREGFCKESARAVLSKGGDALIGISLGRRENKAEVAQNAIRSLVADSLSIYGVSHWAELGEPSLFRSLIADDQPISGARGLLIHVMGGRDLSRFEAGEVREVYISDLGVDTDFFWGTTIKYKPEDEVRVTVIVFWGRSLPANL